MAKVTELTELCGPRNSMTKNDCSANDIKQSACRSQFNTLRSQRRYKTSMAQRPFQSGVSICKTLIPENIMLGHHGITHFNALNVFLFSNFCHLKFFFLKNSGVYMFESLLIFSPLPLIFFPATRRITFLYP